MRAYDPVLGASSTMLSTAAAMAFPGSMFFAGVLGVSGVMCFVIWVCLYIRDVRLGRRKGLFDGEQPLPIAGDATPLYRAWEGPTDIERDIINSVDLHLIVLHDHSDLAGMMEDLRMGREVVRGLCSVCGEPRTRPRSASS